MDWVKSKTTAPWISPALTRKIRRRDKAFSASKKHGKETHEAKFQQLKKEVQCDLRRAYWRYVDNIIAPQDPDSNEFSSMKRFWKFIKNKAIDFNGVAPLKVNGQLTSDPKLKAEALNNQFQSVFTRETEFVSDTPHPVFDSMTPIFISTPGVRQLLSKLDPTKASGPDNISPRVLKELCDVIADPLARVFRKSLSEGQVPIGMPM